MRGFQQTAHDDTMLHVAGGDHAAAAEDITAYNFSSESQRATGSLQGAGLSVAVSTIGDIQQMARRAVDSTVDTSGGLLGGAAHETRRRRQRRRQLQQNGRHLKATVSTCDAQLRGELFVILCWCMAEEVLQRQCGLCAAVVLLVIQGALMTRTPLLVSVQVVLPG